MNFTTVATIVFLPVACIAAAAALMRLFDVKDASPEQSKAESEKLMMQVNREARIQRIRAGAPSNVVVTGPTHFAAQSATRLRFHSA